MKVTLYKIKESLNLEKRSNILDLKVFLGNQKKEGKLFFKESIPCLEENSVFELYFSLFASPKSSINAFPVPIKEFQLYKNKRKHFEFLRKYFQSYYSIHIDDPNFFKQYDYHRPYIGTKYLWYFKKSKATICGE